MSREAAAALRWSGMSSCVWEWIPAGWSCHSGWRHSERRVKSKLPRILSEGCHSQAEVLTIPVRSSNNNAPRLHQSQASVTLDTPPISVNKQTIYIFIFTHFMHKFSHSTVHKQDHNKVDILRLITRWQVTLKKTTQICTWSTVHLFHGFGANL